MKTTDILDARNGSQKVLFGPGSFRMLANVAHEIDKTTIFIVAAPHITRNPSNISFLTTSLGAERFEVYTDFSTNPKYEDALRGAEAYRRLSPTAIIAIGGGSTIDMAKLIRALGATVGDPAKIVTGEEKITASKCPMVAIPTTAGTGSEATHFAVVHKDGTKHSLAHESALPELAVIDPELTLSLSPQETASGGLDALCQAIESYWAVGGTNQSRDFAAQAMCLAWNNLEDAVNRPNNQSRLNMAWAAHLSGRAINISKTTAPHALSYYLTMRHGVPHGHAVALTCGAFFAVNQGGNGMKFPSPEAEKAAEQRLAEIYSYLNIAPATAVAAEGAFHELVARIGLATQLRDVGVSKEELPTMASEVNVERLANNPAILTPLQLQAVLEARF